ncbi:alpha/beta hydrolase [Streptomyces javensis]|uniref:alpha/beta fold hydrolase n=1 Tax=Streptomyces javensis TaxID=114698 RepID=UPI0033E8E6A9
MNLERRVAAVFAGSLLVSSYISYLQLEEEYTRRVGLKGTSLMLDPVGRAIEYDFHQGTLNDESPVLVLENGLGAPLEAWDWVNHVLGGGFRILRYHRSGYWRTKSTLRPAILLESLLTRLAPSGRVIYCGHSMGGLVLANALAESSYLRSRVEAAHIVDGTDAVLLEDDRTSKRRVSRYNQDVARRLLGAVTGTSRWLTSPAEREMEYRPDVQRACLASLSSPQLLLTARREYLGEPTAGQTFLADLAVHRTVIAAGNNVEQQRELAGRLGAKFYSIDSSSHRSIIGKLPFAEQVSSIIRESP